MICPMSRFVTNKTRLGEKVTIIFFGHNSWYCAFVHQKGPVYCTEMFSLRLIATKSIPSSQNRVHRWVWTEKTKVEKNYTWYIIKTRMVRFLTKKKKLGKTTPCISQKSEWWDFWRKKKSWEKLYLVYHKNQNGEISGRNKKMAFRFRLVYFVLQ